ncbi:hypothetical protein KAT92_02555 [Candidatus Babeliales bacterium]|nr:hypothetical protein [Candidatus Babeliales bacterium]
MPDTEKLKDLSRSAARWGGKNISIIKGLAALLFGISLIYLSHRIVINLVVFSCGLLLIYYGFGELKLQKITGFIDRMAAKILRR